MSTNETTIPVNIAVEVVGNWKETYGWIPIFGVVSAFAMAFSAGTNNLGTSFSLPIGSGVLSFWKAVVAAGVIYVPGAAFAGKSSINTLFSDFVRESQPDEGLLMWSMVVVLITATLWLAIATYYEIPVSSQQSTQGALLGTMLATQGFRFMPVWNKNENHNFNGGGLLWIFLEWTVAPMIACVVAFSFFFILKAVVLRHENAKRIILISLPFYYGISAGLLCIFVMYQVIPNFVTIYDWAAIVAIAVATLLGTLSSLVVVVLWARTKSDTLPNIEAIKKENSVKQQGLESQEEKADAEVDDEDEKVEEALREFMQMRILDTVYEEDECIWSSPRATAGNDISQSNSPPKTGQSTAFKQLLESTPNRLVKTRQFRGIEKPAKGENVSRFIIKFVESTFFPVAEYDRHTLIRHALAEKFDEIEDFFGFPLLLASFIFALIQSANEIAALTAPLKVILDVFNHRSKYSRNGDAVTSLQVAWWIRGIGGLSASMGFFLCGWRITQCLGSRIMYVSSSRGVTAQMSSVAALILVTRLKLPASSVHALVGALLGVGIADNPRNVNWKLFLKFLCGWIITVIFCSLAAYGFYSASIHSPSYVVPN